MIKFCYAFDFNFLINSLEFSLYLQTSTCSVLVSENMFTDITSLFSNQASFTIKSNKQILATSTPLIPLNSLQNQPILIDLHSDDKQIFGSIKIMFSVLLAGAYNKFAKVSNSLSSSLKALSLDLEKTKTPLTQNKNSAPNYSLTCNKQISNFFQSFNSFIPKFPELFFTQSLHNKETDLLRNRIQELELQASENHQEKSQLLQENLEYQTEICDLHSNAWEKEKVIRNSLLSEEKKVLDLTQRHTEAITKLRSLEYSYQDLKIKNDYLGLKVESLNQELQLMKNSRSEGESESFVFDKTQEILRKPRLSLLNGLRSASKAVVTKGKQGIDERFLEYLQAYGLENEFERLADELYAYGNRKITVSTKGDSLVCRVGGGYMGIEQFLKGVAEKLGEGEDKVLSVLATPTKSEAKRNQGIDEGLLKENINTPPPKLQKHLKFLSTGKKSTQTFTPLGKVGRMLYK